MFEAQLPARKFKDYVCTSVESYAADGIDKGWEGKTGVVTVEDSDAGANA